MNEFERLVHEAASETFKEFGIEEPIMPEEKNKEPMLSNPALSNYTKELLAEIIADVIAKTHKMKSIAVEQSVILANLATAYKNLQ